MPKLKCPHEWMLNITTTGSLVMCYKCNSKFKPSNQQMPYNGIVPKDYL